MKKKNLCIFAFLFWTLCANAAAQYMTVELKSGDKFSFLLEDNPVVTFKNVNLVVNGNAETSYAIAGVKNYHFTEGDVTGVSDYKSDAVCIESVDNNTLKINNASPSAKIALIGISGVVPFTTMADAAGSAFVSLPEQKGVYVLTVGCQSFKLIRK